MFRFRALHVGYTFGVCRFERISEITGNFLKLTISVFINADFSKPKSGKACTFLARTMEKEVLLSYFQEGGSDGKIGSNLIRQSSSLIIIQHPGFRVHNSMIIDVTKAGTADHIIVPSKMPPVNYKYTDKLLNIMQQS